MTHLATNSAARTALVKIIGVAGCGLLMSTWASAQLSPALDRLSISAGAYRADPKLNASLDTQYGRFESGDLKQRDVTLPRVRADLILFDSQGLSFDYFQYKREYTGSVAQSGSVGGTNLSIAGDATVGMKLDVAKLAYKWWLGSGNTVVGLGLGGAYYKAGIGARANALVNGTGYGFSEGDSEEAIAPVLELGLRHAFTPNFRAFLDVSGVKKSGGKTQGHIVNGSVGLEWFVVKNVGLVVDYSVSRIDLTRNGSNNANLKLTFSGPSAFVKVRF